MMVPWIVRKTGRCADGAQRDAGRVSHVVLTESPLQTPGWSPALCGTRPGRRLGNGWVEVDGAEAPSCPRCARAAERRMAVQS